jgi:hypothetical protein
MHCGCICGRAAAGTRPQSVETLRPLHSPTAPSLLLRSAISLPISMQCRRSTVTARQAVKSDWPATHVGCASANATKRCHSAHNAPSKLTINMPLCMSNLGSQLDRRNIACDYFRPDPPTPASELDCMGYITPINVEHAEVQYLDFPTVLFLDPTILQHGQVDISYAAIPVPPQMLQLLGGMDEIQSVASSYFETIHKWMPFISKKRLYGSHLRPSFQTQPDVVLLLLALKLITTSPPPRPQTPRTSLYQVVKHYHLDVENSSTFSILVLQAGILVALYENSHALYPAAFQSIGTCARYAHSLGINVSKSLHARRLLTLVEIEERRRVWWAIVILDRLVPNPYCRHRYGTNPNQAL